MKKTLGGFIMCSPLIAIFIWGVYTNGWLMTAAIFGGCGLIVALVCFGAYLFTGGR